MTFKFSLAEVGRTFDEWWFSLFGFTSESGNDYNFLLVHHDYCEGWQFDALWLGTLVKFIINQFKVY